MVACFATRPAPTATPTAWRCISTNYKLARGTCQRQQVRVELNFDCDAECRVSAIAHSNVYPLSQIQKFLLPVIDMLAGKKNKIQRSRFLGLVHDADTGKSRTWAMDEKAASAKEKIYMHIFF